MKRCEYLLMCGRCNKYDIPCDATMRKIEAYNSLESPEECNHSWITEVRKSDYKDEQGNEYCVIHQHCVKCGCTDVIMQQLKT